MGVRTEDIGIFTGVPSTAVDVTGVPSTTVDVTGVPSTAVDVTGVLAVIVDVTGVLAVIVDVTGVLATTVDVAGNTTVGEHTVSFMSVSSSNAVKLIGRGTNMRHRSTLQTKVCIRTTRLHILKVQSHSQARLQLCMLWKAWV